MYKYLKMYMDPGTSKNHGQGWGGGTFCKQ